MVDLGHRLDCIAHRAWLVRRSFRPQPCAVCDQDTGLPSL